MTIQSEFRPNMQAGRYSSVFTLPRVPSSGIPALYLDLHLQVANRKLECPKHSRPIAATTPRPLRIFERNGRPAPARYYQRRLPSSTALLQIFHAAKPRAPTRTSRVLRPTHVACYPTNYSPYSRRALSTARITQPHTSTSTSSGQIPLLRHSSRSFFNTSLRSPANTNPHPPPLPHT